MADTSNLLLCKNQYCGIFFVEQFPYEAADHENINGLSAKTEGIYSFVNTQGGNTTVRKLSYGVACPIPQDLAIDAIIKIQKEQEKAASQAVQRHKRAEESTVRWLFPQATNGDAEAQCDLGEHLLNGQDAKTNRNEAMYWLKIICCSRQCRSIQCIEAVEIDFAPLLKC